MAHSPFRVDVAPDAEALLRCLRRDGTPARVHHMELYLDGEVQQEIVKRFELDRGIDPADPYADLKTQVKLQRFLGYDTVRSSLEGVDMPLNWDAAQDTAGLKRQGGRSFINEHRGPIASWDDFERYPWPDPAQASTRALDWYEANLPDDMCVVAHGGFAHFNEFLNWLMGYETLCMALFLQRDLVEAIANKLIEIQKVFLQRLLQYERVKIIWGSDDMGFRTATMIAPDDLRAFVLPGHRLMAQMTHAAGRPYLLHSCGNLAAIMDDLVDDVRIDAKHSFEDTIERVEDVKDRWGNRIALIGGIDMDFICRSGEAAIRQRVRTTLDRCQAGGGYCLGTGNSVANYLPVDHYLAMLDEGRCYSA